MIQQPILSVKNLSFGYERKPVLKQVSFAVMSGDIVGLVGGTVRARRPLAACCIRFC